MTYDLLGTTKYETEYVETEELPWGEQRQKQNGYTGYEVVSYRNVYKGDGTLLSSNVEAKSNYKSRNQIILTGTAVLLTGMPAGTLSVMLGAKYGSDAPFASRLVIFTTLLSLVTIPLWCLVCVYLV